jgi:hypothetical protein
MNMSGRTWINQQIAGIERAKEAQEIADYVNSEFASDAVLRSMSEEFRVKWGILWTLCL